MRSPASIDQYLDLLLGELRVDPSRVRRIVAEAEDHLRESAAALEASGMARGEAEIEAMRRFGTYRRVARRFATAEGRFLPPSITVGLLAALAPVAAVGLLAIGMSGALAALMGLAFGKSFVSGDTAGVTYTAGRCADYLRLVPSAATCAAAATEHHFDEIVSHRLAAGVLGMVVLGGYFLVRLRYRWLAGVRVLPGALAPGVAAALFGVAAAGLLVLGGMPVLLGEATGAGAYLSGGFVAGLVAGVYGWRLLATLRSQSPA